MEELLANLLYYLLDVSLATLSQLFILLGPLLILGLAMYFITNWMREQGGQLFRWTLWVYGTFLGVVVHELGHAVFALLFGHRIRELKLFAPDPLTGSLGYVRHAYDPENLYQQIGNFFIGIGPLILGPLAIYFSAKYLLGAEVFLPLQDLSIDSGSLGSWQGLLDFLAQAFPASLQLLGAMFSPEKWATWQFYLFLYLAVSIGAHVQLSPPDIQGALQGFVFLVLVFLVFNLLTLWTGGFAQEYTLWLASTYSFFYAILLLTLLLNLLILALFSLVAGLRRLARGY